MNQVVIIIPKMSAKVDIKKLKKEIVAYVGLRLIESSTDDMPAVMFKESLNEEDMKHITSLIPESDGSMIFIDVNEDSADGEYIYAETKTF